MTTSSPEPSALSALSKLASLRRKPINGGKATKHCTNPDCMVFTNYLSRKGLCIRCEEYQRRNGRPRTRDRMLSVISPEPYIVGLGAPPRIKPRCSFHLCRAEVSHLNRGRCAGCYTHYLEFGCDRTPEEWELLQRKRNRQPAFCVNPKCATWTEKPHVSGRCRPCQATWVKLKIERTPNASRLKACVNCGADPRNKRGHIQLNRGRCGPCRMFFQRHGVDRAPDQRARYIAEQNARSKQTRPCNNCGGAAKLNAKYGRCSRCQEFFKHHRRERTREESLFWGPEGDDKLRITRASREADRQAAADAAQRYLKENHPDIMQETIAP